MVLISCKKAGEYCDRAQYKEVRWKDILKLRVHLMFCKCCRDHSKNNHHLTCLMEKAELHKLTREEREHLKKLLEKARGEK